MTFAKTILQFATLSLCLFALSAGSAAITASTAEAANEKTETPGHAGMQTQVRQVSLQGLIQEKWPDHLPLWPADFKAFDGRAGTAGLQTAVLYVGQRTSVQTERQMVV